MPFLSTTSHGLSASSYLLAGGRDGIIQTAQVMRDLVETYKRDPEMRALALNLIDFIPQKDFVAEIECLFSYVQNQIRYVQDIYDVETLATPPQVVAMGQGDCDDKATLLATLLETIGIKTAFVLAGYHGAEFEHVYVYAENPADGFAAYLDPTEPEPMGYEPPNPTAKLIVD